MNYLSRIGLDDILRRAQDNVGAPSQFLIVGSKSLLGSYDLDQLSGPGSEPLKSSEEVEILRLDVHDRPARPHPPQRDPGKSR